MNTIYVLEDSPLIADLVKIQDLVREAYNIAHNYLWADELDTVRKALNELDFMVGKLETKTIEE